MNVKKNKLKAMDWRSSLCVRKMVILRIMEPAYQKLNGMDEYRG